MSYLMSIYCHSMSQCIACFSQVFFYITATLEYIYIYINLFRDNGAERSLYCVPKVGFVIIIYIYIYIYQILNVTTHVCCGINQVPVRAYIYIYLYIFVCLSALWLNVFLDVWYEWFATGRMHGNGQKFRSKYINCYLVIGEQTW